MGENILWSKLLTSYCFEKLGWYLIGFLYVVLKYIELYIIVKGEFLRDG